VCGRWAAHALLRLLQQRLGARGGARHERAVLGTAPACEYLLLAHAHGGHLVLRQVDATHGRVGPRVSQDVDQLHRLAERHRRLARRLRLRLRLDAQERQQHEAHRARHLVGVQLELGVVGDAPLLLQVGAHPGDHVGERLAGQRRVPPERLGEGRIHLVARLAVAQAVEPGGPLVESSARVGHAAARRRVVDDLVQPAAPGVESASILCRRLTQEVLHVEQDRVMLFHEGRDGGLAPRSHQCVRGHGE